MRNRLDLWFGDIVYSAGRQGAKMDGYVCDGYDCSKLYLNAIVSITKKKNREP